MREIGFQKWSTYDYTDISPKFLDLARSKFAKFAHSLEFKVLDISKDPISQSFEPSTYDLIVASHVLHATIHLKQTLSNLRRLLRPSGKLLILETTSPDSIQLGFAFGLLRDWWAPLEYEQRSVCSPCLSVDRWDVALKASGFSGVDIAIDSGKRSLHPSEQSIIISTNTAPDFPLRQVKIIIDEHVETQRALAAVLISEHSAASCEVLTLPSAARAVLKEAVVIFLLEVDSIFLYDVSEANYKHLNLVLQQCQQVVWVTRWRLGKNPHHGIVDGLGRVMMSEDSRFKFSTLALDAQSSDPVKVAAVIGNAARQVSELPVERIDNFTMVNGTLSSLRITENRIMDKRVAASISPWHAREIQALSGDVPLRLHISSPGQLSTLQWKETRPPAQYAKSTALGDHEVIVQVRAIGLCSRDLKVAMGQYDASELGIEFAGIVQQAGTHSGFAHKDKVFAISPGASATLMKMPAEALVLMPPYLSFADAATMPKALWMAYHGVVNSGRVIRGETILICQGASDVGQMAIRMAIRLGAEVLVAVTSEQERELLETGHGLGSGDVFDARDGAFLRRIFQRTQGNGVDIVMTVPQHDHVSVDYTQCLATSGRLVRAGISLPPGFDAKRSAHIQRPADLSIISFGMLDLFAAKPQKAYSIFHHAAGMAFEHEIGLLQPVQSFHPQDLEAAFQYLQDAQIAGNPVIELGSTDKVIVCVSRTPPHCSNSVPLLTDASL